MLINRLDPPRPLAGIEEAAKLSSMPVQNPQAAGIDVGDRTHWVCVEQTPDGSPTTREFPAHTRGVRELMAWLKWCGITTIALEARGVYGNVLFLTLRVGHPSDL